jgi:hypothetical protein
MSIEAMKLALEALEYDSRPESEYGINSAITILRQAIEAAEKQEPVAWELRKGKTDRVLLEITNDPKRAHDWKCSLEEVVPLYTHPPKREWVGLTDDKELWEMWVESPSDVLCFAHAIEAKLREKNGC